MPEWLITEWVYVQARGIYDEGEERKTEEGLDFMSEIRVLVKLHCSHFVVTVRVDGTSHDFVRSRSEFDTNNGEGKTSRCQDTSNEGERPCPRWVRTGTREFDPVHQPSPNRPKERNHT